MNKAILAAFLAIAMNLPFWTSSADDTGPDSRLVKILKKGPVGISQFNQWRRLNPIEEVNLRGADLRGADLRGADLRLADLRNAELGGAVFGLDLSEELKKHDECKKRHTNEASKSTDPLRGLRENALAGAAAMINCGNIISVYGRVRKSAADLRGADLDGANLDGAVFTGAKGCDEVFNAPDDFVMRCANPKERKPVRQYLDTEARISNIDVGNLCEVVGRQLSATATDVNGWTDLHYAAAMDLPETAGANVHTESDDGMTALQVADDLGNDEVGEILKR